MREAAAISQNLNQIPKEASLSNSSATGSTMIPQIAKRRPLVLRKNNFVQARRAGGGKNMETSAESNEVV